MAETFTRVAASPSLTTRPSITVHVPCYNYGRFLGEAIESILAQSFTDWEAVVIDDASTDDTGTVLERYRDPRIRVVRHSTRQGHIPTYNEGIALANGEFFVILSADDRYKPRFLEKVLGCFAAHPEISLATTHGDRIDEDGRVFRTEVAPYGHTGVYDALPLLFERTFVAASAGVARTAKIRALGGYDPAFEHSCDAYLWRQLAIEGPVGYVHERLYERRFHPRSMSRGAHRSEVLEKEHAEQLGRIFDRHDLPPRVAAMRRRAFSELYWKIAHAYFSERHFGRTVANASLAVRCSGAAVARHLTARPLRQIRRAWNRFRQSSSGRHGGGELSERSVLVHETALCESADVGEGTRIWAFAHVMEGARLGAACKIGDHVFVENGAVIGDRVTIKNGTLVWERIRIDDDVFVGPGVVFTNDLVPRAHTARRGADLMSTHVHRGASIGANATIVCGTTIGAHAMVGAASVVTHDVAAYALVAGSPASQVAWVCRCGLRLGSELRCDCGRRYRSTDAGGIAPEPS